MIYNKIIKLKKYLFLISILFFVLSLVHLIYIYIYNDSKMVAVKGGSISEWLVWNFPSLNPLVPLNWNNKYIIDLLYRSLLKYDLKENKIVWDLANCDISNLLNIECYIKDNIFWSNGEPITAADVIATYDILKKTWVNKVTSSLIWETQIIQNDNAIIFKSNKKDVNFLNVFFQPILPKNTIESLWEDTIFWNFPTSWQIYSWGFKISNITSDLTIWITSIFLDRNEKSYDWNISKLIIKLFPNTNSLLQNKESINIYNDVDNIIGESIPRLKSHKYTLPQYVSLFINENNVKDINIRNYILEKINTENLIKILWEDKFEAINNPYLTETSINNDINNKNFEKIIADLWYVKKSKIIERYLPVVNNTWANIEKPVQKVQENIIKLEVKNVVIDENNLTIDKFQQKSKYITSPTYVDKYNFVTKDDTLLEWNVWSNVTGVYINDYKLASFKSGNTNFYYRLKESIWNFKAWVNNYKIYFVENWNKVFKEELNFLYYKDKLVLETETKKYIRELYLTEQNKNTEVQQVKKEEVKKDVVQKEVVKVNSEGREGTLGWKKVEVQKIDKEKQVKLEKIKNLDGKFYYNDKLEKFSINLYYVSSEKELEMSAQFIKNSLHEIWINIELFPITINDLRGLLANKDKYDMILTWVNVWFFDYNIFPYFHSSQVKNWYNFNNIKKASLDILLEELKSDVKNTEEINKIRVKVLDILRKEQIVKTLYTPKINLLIDKNIKNIIIPSKLANQSDRKDIFDYLYIKENKIINLKNKWVSGFFNFLLKKIKWQN